MRDQSRHPMSAKREQVVAITGVDYDTNKIFCRDAVGNEFEVDGSLRVKGAGFPQVDEKWLMVRIGGTLVLDKQIGAPRIPLIEGVRTGMHPVAVQMLEALSRHGLIEDGTVGGAQISALDDTSDPPPTPVPGEYEPDEQADVALGGEDPEDPDEIPSKHNGPDDKDKDEEDERDRRNRDFRVFVTTYNIKNSVGPERVWEDLNRLRKGRTDILCTQEMQYEERNSVCNRLTDKGFNMYRPSGGAMSKGNTIFWRDDLFSKKQDGWDVLSPGTAPPGQRDPVPITYTWVRLEHRASKRDLFVINTHFLPQVEGWVNGFHVPPRKGGHPSTVRDLQTFVNYTYSGIAQIKAKMRQFGKIAPVFTCLDSNIDAFADMRVRHDRFPYAQWKQVETFSNWDLIRRRPPYASAFGRHIDQVWLTRGKHHQVRFEDHWVLTGFHSDHRPVMVKAKMKGKA